MTDYIKAYRDSSSPYHTEATWLATQMADATFVQGVS